jgi:hypothetical protein
MNPLHIEFLAADRMADLRRDAAAARLASDAGPQRASWLGRIEAVSARTVGRLRLARRLADVS